MNSKRLVRAHQTRSIGQVTEFVGNPRGNTSNLDRHISASSPSLLTVYRSPSHLTLHINISPTQDIPNNPPSAMKVSTSILLSILSFAVSALAQLSGSDSCLTDECQALLLLCSDCSYPLQTTADITPTQSQCICDSTGFADVLGMYVPPPSPCVRMHATDYRLPDVSIACNPTTWPTSLNQRGTDSALPSTRPATRKTATRKAAIRRRGSRARTRR